jgi:hypothetical protein
VFANLDKNLHTDATAVFYNSHECIIGTVSIISGNCYGGGEICLRNVNKYIRTDKKCPLKSPYLRFILACGVGLGAAYTGFKLWNSK